MIVEEWRQSLSLPDYEVSSLGRVRRKSHEAPMSRGGFRTYGGKAWKGAWEKVQRRYTIQYLGKTYRIARLVCEAFHGPAPFPLAVACHDDEDSRNNASANLTWGTQMQNLNYPGFLAYASRVCRQKMSGEQIQRLET